MTKFKRKEVLARVKKIGIYVHIPFCKKKCKYCDFVSFSGMEDRVEEYFNALFEEISIKSDEIYKNLEVNEESDSVANKYENGKVNKNERVEVDTIYIGGGTPSVVSEKYIEELIYLIHKKFVISETAEITIEVNPGTVSEEKLRNYINLGINRISIGLQSANNELLKLLGRIHTYEEFESTFESARKVGFKNINVDLMIGLPKQSMKDVEESLNKIISKSPEHISVYSLILEEGTEMLELIEKNILKLPDENLEREMYWQVKKTLEENGYNHYEISNFAKNNYSSKHNMNCWNQHDYLGFGVSAHSYYDGIRYSNITGLKTYIENIKNNTPIYNVVFHENQLKDDMMREYMLLRIKED